MQPCSQSHLPVCMPGDEILMSDSMNETVDHLQIIEKLFNFITLTACIVDSNTVLYSVHFFPELFNVSCASTLSHTCM